jgi:hypothetical protein
MQKIFSYHEMSLSHLTLQKRQLVHGCKGAKEDQHFKCCFLQVHKIIITARLSEFFIVENTHSSVMILQSVRIYSIRGYLILILESKM